MQKCEKLQLLVHLSLAEKVSQSNFRAVLFLIDQLIFNCEGGELFHYSQV